MSDVPQSWWTPQMRLDWERRVRQRREDEAQERRRRSEGDDGFIVGLATGIPIPLTPMSIAGAALHNSMRSSSGYESSSSSSYDSSSSSSSDSSSSSSSSSD